MKKHEIELIQNDLEKTQEGLEKESNKENQTSFVKNLRRIGNRSLGFSAGFGTAFGAILGTFILPGLGTLAGAGFGAAFGITFGLTVRGIMGLVSNKETGKKSVAPAAQVVIGMGGLGLLIGTFVAPGIGSVIGLIVGATLGALVSHRPPEPIKLANSADFEVFEDLNNSNQTNPYSYQKLRPGNNLVNTNQASQNFTGSQLYHLDSEDEEKKQDLSIDSDDENQDSYNNLYTRTGY